MITPTRSKTKSFQQSKPLVTWDATFHLFKRDAFTIVESSTTRITTDELCQLTKGLNQLVKNKQGSRSFLLFLLLAMGLLLATAILVPTFLMPQFLVILLVESVVSILLLFILACSILYQMKVTHMIYREVCDYLLTLENIYHTRNLYFVFGTCFSSHDNTSQLQRHWPWTRYRLSLHFDPVGVTSGPKPSKKSTFIKGKSSLVDDAKVKGGTSKGKTGQLGTIKGGAPTVQGENQSSTKGSPLAPLKGSKHSTTN